MRIYESIDQLIGHTPLLRIKKIEEKYGLKSKLFVKLECFNPAGSVKDRPAKSMLDQAEKEGLLDKDTVVIEPTSGNTGIGLSALCSSRGYKIILTMPESMSIERRNILKAHGAELVLTPASEGMKGAVNKANELAKQYKKTFIPSQFDNRYNALAHFNGTGPEIYDDLDGKVDIFVAGIGTGGTITGIGEYLKGKNKDIKIVGVESASSPLLTKGMAGPHKIQGIGANFIPSILNKEILDEVKPVKDEDAFRLGKEFALEIGILIGISSGAALSAAIEIAKKEEGKNIIVLLPDGGDKYLSSDMYK